MGIRFGLITEDMDDLDLVLKADDVLSIPTAEELDKAIMNVPLPSPTIVCDDKTIKATGTLVVDDDVVIKEKPAVVVTVDTETYRDRGTTTPPSHHQRKKKNVSLFETMFTNKVEF